MGTQRRLGSIIIGVVVAWAFVAIVLAGMLWPHLPRTIFGWLAFAIFGPLLYFAAELFSDRAWSSRMGRMISNHPSSLVRILCGVLIGSAVLAASMGISWFITQH
jgi:hypothetical protein